MAFFRKVYPLFKKLMIQLAFVIGLSLTIPMTACAYT
ncbi:N-acetylmuramoyl-L-alanine amidase, partial [Enterococcus faecalis]